MSKVLVCRTCGGDAIASLDQYLATCRGDASVNDKGEVDFEPAGYTEISWDSCKQLGWECLSCFDTVQVDTENENDNLDAALLRLATTKPHD